MTTTAVRSTAPKPLVYTIMKCRQHALILAAICSAGCATQNQQIAEIEGLSYRSQASVVERAIQQLEARRPDLATVELKSGLAKQPSDANLHFLNGLAYRELSRHNGQTELDLAETGYRLALEFDEEHWLAAWHLGVMQAEQKNFADARKSLARAAQLRPDHPEIQLALAGTAFQVKDMPVALLAAERTMVQRPRDREAVRIAALSSAALGLADRSHEYVRQLSASAESETSRSEAVDVKEKVAQWAALLARFDSTKARELTRDNVANEPPAPTAPNSAPGAPLPDGTSSKGASRHSVIAQHWADCAQRVGRAGDGEGGSSSGWGASSSSIGSSTWGSSSGFSSFGPTSTGFGGGTQQNVAALDQSPTAALPSPCQGIALPRMVVVDTMLIRTEEVTGFDQGVNVLDGLKVVLTGGNEKRRSTADGETQRSTTITRNIGLPSNGITYALGIFNGTDQKAEVLARPSLVALDRMPATFFSGSIITLSLLGNFSSNVADKPVGVSLSVTPTFIDDETLLLAVKAGRSFIDGADHLGSLTMSANSMSTNVIIRYGQTLVLSGLRERYASRNRTGIPVLRDIPGIQYLTSNNQLVEYSQHVMIVLTPRKPYQSEDERTRNIAGRSPNRASYDDIASREAREKFASMVTNIDSINQFLQTSEYTKEFRTGAISPRRFAAPPNLSRTIQDLRQLLLY